MSINAWASLSRSLPPSVRKAALYRAGIGYLTLESQVGPAEARKRAVRELLRQALPAAGEAAEVAPLCALGEILKEQCKPGQNPARDGCTTASGNGHAKPADAKPAAQTEGTPPAPDTPAGKAARRNVAQHLLSELPKQWDAVKDCAGRIGKAAWDKLPASAQKAAAKTWGLAMAVHHKVDHYAGAGYAASQALVKGGSYFEDCPRDDEGHCKPSVESEDGGKKPAAGNKPEGETADAEAAKVAAAEADYKANGVKAKAFKDWFGDWEGDPAGASKVVNKDGEPQETHNIPGTGSVVNGEDGKPVVVYHGTAQGGFEAFDRSKIAGHLLYGPGFYFTEDKEVAATYAQGREGSEVKALYLNIRKPADMDATVTPEMVNVIADALERVTDPKTPKSGSKDTGKVAAEKLRKNAKKYAKQEYSVGGLLSELSDKVHIGTQVVETDGGKMRVFRSFTGEDYQSLLVAAGFDGITHTGGKIMGDGHRHRVWIAFDPTQIKSADNRGTFDPKDPRLTKQIATDRGLTPEQVERVSRVTALVDLAARWTVPTAVWAAGQAAGLGEAGAVAAKVAYYMPLGSLAYIAWSMKDDPFHAAGVAKRLAKVAWDGLRKKSAHKAMDEAAVSRLADGLQAAADPDAYLALVCCGLDLAGDLGGALDVADAAMQSVPKACPGCGGVTKAIRGGRRCGCPPCEWSEKAGSYFEDCPRDDAGHCKPSGESGDKPAPDAGEPVADKPAAVPEAPEARESRRETEDETIDAGREKEDEGIEARREEEDESLSRKRDKEDRINTRAMDKRRAKEDRQTERVREREDAKRERARDRQDEKFNDKQSKEADALYDRQGKENDALQAAHEKESNALEESQQVEYGKAEAAGASPEELDALSKRQDEETDAVDAGHAAEQAATETRHAAEEKDMDDRHDKEIQAWDQARDAERTAEDDAIAKARDAEDDKRASARDAEDEAESARIQAVRDAEDDAIRAARDREDADLYDRREAEDADIVARRDEEDDQLPDDDEEEEDAD